MKFTSSFIRGFIASTAFIILLGVCLVGICKRTSTDTTDTQNIIPTTTESTCLTTVFTTTTTSTTTSATTTTSSTSSTSTSTSTSNTSTSTTAITTTTVIELTTETQIQTTECIQTERVETYDVIDTCSFLSEQDWILISNVISHEAGSSHISTYERSCIAAAIMNRVYDSRFPNTVDEVVHQAGQMFDVPYYRVDYSGIGYEPIDEAIRMYLANPDSYGNINSWCGDGYHNYFSYQ